MFHYRSIRILIITILFAAFLAVAGSLAVLAQSDEQIALGGAVRLLGEKLSMSIQIIDSYTAEITTFEDSGFGCTEDGEIVVREQIQGFKFAIVYQGVTYDIRTNYDGTRGRLCDTPVQKIAVGLATYRTTEYSIAYPELWNVIDRTTDTYFGPGALPACANPGMLMVPLGRVGDKSPDTLLEEYQSTLSGTALDPNRRSLRSIGRSTLYQVKCTDGSVRQARVTVFVAFGRGFRIVQYAPLADFPAWADLYWQILERFSPSTQNATTGGETFSIPTQSPLAAIVHVFAGNVYVGALTDIPGRPITTGGTPERPYSHPALSPDGRLVSFLAPFNGANTLYIAAANGDNTQPFKIAEDVSSLHRPVWNPDGTAIAYTTGSALYTARVDGSGSRLLTNLSSAACDAEVLNPAQELAFRDRPPAVLEWLPDNTILIVPDCVGATLLRIDTTTGERKELATGIYFGSLSGDKAKIVGVRFGGDASQIVILNVADGATTEIQINARVGNVNWGTSGASIYYETRELERELVLEDAVAIFGFQAELRTAVYTVRLHRLELSSGVDAVIFEKEGFSLSRILPAPDGSGLLIGFVQDEAPLVAAAEANVAAADLKRAFPQSLLIWLPLPAGEAQIVAITQQAVWGPLGSALAPTPTGGYTIPPNRRTFTPTPNVVLVTATPPIAQETPGIPIRQSLPTNTPRS